MLALSTTLPVRRTVRLCLFRHPGGPACHASYRPLFLLLSLCVAFLFAADRLCFTA